MKKVLVLDNYDSFTYNLVHYVAQFTDYVEVYRNDKISINEVDRFDAIIISPGPGLPPEAGISIELVKKYAPTKKILGVCLGHQAIAMAYGGKLRNLNQVLHGISLKSLKAYSGDYMFNEIPEKFSCGRYHSWVIDEIGFPDELEITATDESGNIMAIKHKNFDIHGVQFHPESVMTGYGLKMIENWISR